MEFSLAVVSCRDETQCVGKVHNLSSAQRAAAFDFLKENLMVDVKLVLTHFDFHLSAIFISLLP